MHLKTMSANLTAVLLMLGTHGLAEKPPASLPCRRPVQKDIVHFPEHLLDGQTKAPTMYSGYVNVTLTDYLFYWFVEADPSAGPDAPIILWSNGGPGCSSMEGATTEIGPLVMYGVKTHATWSGKLSRNTYAWNQKAHLLFVDQPRYVGYSFGTGPYSLTSQQAGLDMVKFLLGWRQLFPTMVRPSFILASESYGGQYVPAWTEAILDYNHDASAQEHIHIGGIILLNAFVSQKVQNHQSLIDWAEKQKLLPENVARLARKVTNDNIAVERLIEAQLGYKPNDYDYRLASVGDTCCSCYGYNYTNWARWLWREDVRAALHVCGSAGESSFTGCAGGCIRFPSEFDAHSTFDAQIALGRALQLGLPVMLLYGKQDMTCDYVGGMAMAKGMKWPGAANWANESLRTLLTEGESSGQWKSSGGLTWIQIDAAGHMSPVDNPSAAYFALEELLRAVQARKRNDLQLVRKDAVNRAANFAAHGALATSPGAALAICVLGMFSIFVLGLAWTLVQRRWRLLDGLASVDLDEELQHDDTTQRCRQHLCS